VYVKMWVKGTWAERGRTSESVSVTGSKELTPEEAEQMTGDGGVMGPGLMASAFGLSEAANDAFMQAVATGAASMPAKGHKKITKRADEPAAPQDSIPRLGDEPVNRKGPRGPFKGPRVPF